MTVACGDLHDVCPCGDIALAIVVVPNPDSSAVCLDANCMRFTCGNLDYVRPATEEGLPVSRRTHCAVGLEPYRVIAACANLDNINPCADIALPKAVIPDRDGRPV